MAKLTQDEKDAIRDGGVAQWWADWYEADYSWEGLTKYPWQGWMVVEDTAAYDAYIKAHGLPEGCPNRACQVIPNDYDGLPDSTQTRDATLQDYWRDQEELLQKSLGQKKYTQAHLPVHYRNGTISWKTNPNHGNWRTLSALVEERLGLGVKTEVYLKRGADKVLGQDGRAMFRGCLLPAIPSKICKPESNERLEKYKGRQPPTLGALHISLWQAGILEPQNFIDTIFGSTTNFTLTSFLSGDVKFYRAKFYGGEVSFSGALFSGGMVSFTGAEFSGGKVNFTDVQFSGGNSNFTRTKFLEGATNFTRARFTGGFANFSQAIFSGGDVSFSQAQFSGGDANFIDVQFLGGEAHFYNTQFSGGSVGFIRARFEKNYKFHGTQFHKGASFENATFPPAAMSYDSFRGAQFLGSVKLNRTTYKKSGGIPLPSSELQFPFNAFGLTNFKGQVILTQRGDKEAQIEFDRALGSTAEACKGKDNDFIEAQYVALESGCTTLKRAMETVSDKNRAQRYFKFELLARQQRPSTPPLVKWFTKFYGWTADYGGSISRPLITLAVLWFGFALIYGVNAHFAGVGLPTTQKLIGAADFSATQIFRPLFIWSKTGMGDAESWLAQFREGYNAFGWLSIKLVATAQSFLSLTLIFLFGLATKRKFQIS